MASRQAVCLQHIARESPDVKRLSAFYQEVFGFEKMETPSFRNMEVVWLRLPPAFSLHIIERDPQSMLPEGPLRSIRPGVRDPTGLPRGHHLSFAVADFDAFVKMLKDKGIEVYEKTQPDGKTKQAFFFDPDGNGLEVGSWDAPKL